MVGKSRRFHLPLTSALKSPVTRIVAVQLYGCETTEVVTDFLHFHVPNPFAQWTGNPLSFQSIYTGWYILME